MATPKIFVVEDDRSIVSIIESVLSSKDYDVVTTDSADGALSTILDKQPDAAVLDVRLPGEKNGFQLCHRIKNHPEIGNLPVMILTATTRNTTESDEEWRKKSKADDFITKPFESADFARRVELLVEKAWKQKEGTRFEL